MSDNRPHIPVLEETVLDLLKPMPGERVLDVTLGLGGHAKRFLEAISPSGTLIGLDADNVNLAYSRKILEPFGDRAILIHSNFGNLPHLEIEPVDVLFADLGLSSPHVDDPERGFAFRVASPLDQRYDRTSGKSTKELIEQSDEEDLVQIFRDYGELFKEARHLAKNLAGKSFETTVDLREAIETAFGFRAKFILAQVFQALRIAVNDEMGVLRTLLETGPSLLAPGGRMGVLSYHSLEDRMVKHAFRPLATPVKDEITGKVAIEAGFEIVTPKAIVATEEEVIANPRARSVKFRILKRKV